MSCFFLYFCIVPHLLQSIPIMKTVLILVGKTTNKHISACIDDYVGRITHYMPFEILVIPEL